MQTGTLRAVIFLLAIGCGGLPAHGQTAAEPASGPDASRMTLVQAAMCEEIINYVPWNPGVVFSIASGKISCFTAFEDIPETTFVYHQWFRQDKLVTHKRLTLKPPQWSTFSSIQLREADKGPWRVEIVDPDGKTLKTIRFSITD